MQRFGSWMTTKVGVILKELGGHSIRNRFIRGIMSCNWTHVEIPGGGFQRVGSTGDLDLGVPCMEL